MANAIYICHFTVFEMCFAILYLNTIFNAYAPYSRHYFLAIVCKRDVIRETYSSQR